MCFAIEQYIFEEIHGYMDFVGFIINCRGGIRNVFVLDVVACVHVWCVCVCMYGVCVAASCCGIQMGGDAVRSHRPVVLNSGDTRPDGRPW